VTNTADEVAPIDVRVPPRALLLSALALVVPVLSALLIPETLGEYGAMVWLLALVPAFLLAYYRGWRGAATALAAGMATLSITQAVANALGILIPDMLLGIVVAYIGITLGIGALAERMHRDRHRVQTMAYTDGLTRLPNRRHARIFLENEFAAASRGRLLAVVLFDLDNFKSYNDRYGHPEGDEALRAFGTVLARQTRRMNLSGRLGGEEFVTVLNDTDAEGAMLFADRVRSTLKTQGLGDPVLTVSAGVAAFHPGMKSADELLAAADHALYQAKAAGRDRVKLFGRAIVESSQERFPPPMPPLDTEPEGEYPRSAEELGKSIPPPTLLPHEISGFGRGRSILVVEPEGPVLGLIEDYLSREEFQVATAPDAPQALRLLGSEFDVVVASYPLPSAAGHEMVRAVKSRWPTTQVVVMTTRDDPATVADAMQAGADRLIRKPFEMTSLRSELGNALKRRDRIASASLAAQLMGLEGGGAGTDAFAAVREGLRTILRGAERHQPDTEGHGARTARFAKVLGSALADPPDPDALEWGSLLHDVGRLSVPREILEKKGSLEEDEWVAVRKHTRAGRTMVEPLLGPGSVTAAITWHHERWDGDGYPDGLAGEAIPMVARIVAVADALSAMLSPRAHRPALSWKEAVSQIRDGFGTAYDPGLEDVFESTLGQLKARAMTDEA